MTDLNIDHPRRRWLPRTAGAVGASLFVAGTAVAWHRMTADTTTPPPRAALVVMPVASDQARTCQTPAPMAVTQLAALAAAPAVPPVPLGTPVPARTALRGITGRIAAAPCDTRQGRYAHTQVLQWVTNTVSAGGTTALSVQVWQYQRWRAPDNSGRVIAVTQPAQDQTRTDDSYPPGQLPTRATNLDSSAELLAGQLNDIQPLHAGPQSVLRAWDEVNAGDSPHRAQRAAALTIVARTDGITAHGLVRDRAGRTGIALAATSDNGATRDLLILDPHTAELLAYEMTALRDPGHLGITTPTVLTYDLFLTHTRTATTG